MLGTSLVLHYSAVQLTEMCFNKAINWLTSLLWSCHEENERRIVDCETDFIKGHSKVVRTFFLCWHTHLHFIVQGLILPTVQVTARQCVFCNMFDQEYVFNEIKMICIQFFTVSSTTYMYRIVLNCERVTSGRSRLFTFYTLGLSSDIKA